MKVHGFTLIELTIVMLLISIMSVMVVASWPSSSDTTLGSQASLLAQNLRHIQALAMQQEKTFTLESVATGYSGKEGISVITDPATGDLFQVTLGSGVALSVASIDFDYLGRPLSGGTFISSAQDFVLSGDTRSATVSVTPITGFISVTP